MGGLKMQGPVCIYSDIQSVAVEWIQVYHIIFVSGSVSKEKAKREHHMSKRRKKLSEENVPKNRKKFVSDKDLHIHYVENVFGA